MSTHTPGPWAFEIYENKICNQGCRVIGSNGDTVCNNEPYYPHGISEADGRLIAAAPELLAIVKGVLGMLQNCSVTSGVCCCGEEIDRHSRAMDCGHTPVDSGAYYAQSLFKDVTAAITKATGEL